MKSFYRLLFNLCSIALLIFALYLNFIKKEDTEATVQLSNTKPIDDAAEKLPQQNSAPTKLLQTSALK